MGLLLGVIEGMVALVLWFDWEDNILLYVAGCLAPLCLSLPMAWHALLADRPYREVYGRPLRLMRSVLAVIVLSVGLGSIAVSVLDDFNLNTPIRIISTVVFAAAAVAGGLVGHKLAGLEQRVGFIHPEPHFGQLTGVLVGANFAVTFAAIPLLTMQTSPIWYPWVLTGAAGLVGGLLSLWRCRVKTRATSPTRWRSWTALAVASDSLTCGMAAIMGCVLWDINSWPDVLWMGGSMLAGAAIWVVLGILSRRGFPSTVVVPEDQPMVCPSCGYNLTGLPEPRCPECGREFDESQVRRARAYTPFPVTLWHPVSTSPVGGALVGSCLGVTIAAFL
ncbi:MAG TPA: hypothetical protein PKY77_12180 [Phycisphaerae bacterium]|nr:hypothetical protein [Phycisphaerae bacterium]HRY69280.1 hypothetical protein [Phycisphaerae bacterium]HSA26598.1 hypothetical protein [Phycisphaerae bacterium]